MKSRLAGSATTVFLVLSFLGTTAVTRADSMPSGTFGSAFKDLAGEDQVSFVQTINRSMAKEPDKLDDKRIQTLYRVNRDAVRGAPEGDRRNVLAEVFATAPVKCLPYFTDSFAREVFSRKSAPYGNKDEAFVEFASAALMKISQRCRYADDLRAFRTVFAVIMFLKASEGRPEDLRESFMVFIHSGVHEIARKEWLPAALGDNGERPTYEPMMKAGYRQEPPDHKIRVGAADPPELLNLFVHSDLAVEYDAWDVQSPTPAEPWRVQPGGDTMGAGLWRTPRTRVSREKDPEPTPEPEPGPGPYLGQTL